MRKHFLFCGFLVLLLMAGCGKKGLDVHPVQGGVTVDGKKVKGVNITFEPVDRTSIEKAFGETDAQGVYKLTSTNGPPQGGALVGEYKVKASWPELEKFEVIRYSDGSETKYPTGEEKLPEHYLDAETSGLTATVKRGKNTINFDLVTKP